MTAVNITYAIPSKVYWRCLSAKLVDTQEILEPLSCWSSQNEALQQPMLNTMVALVLLQNTSFRSCTEKSYIHREI